MGTGRRGRWAVTVAAAVIATLAGCDPTGPSSTAGPSPSGKTPSVAPTPTRAAPTTLPPTPRPAALAGGACLLVDFDVIKSTLGTDFNVAAAADASGTYTCFVQSSVAETPNLVLSITATDLSPDEFKADAQPAHTVPVDGLGKIGYELKIAATTKVGPAIEVGWLSGNDRLIVLRYTCAPGIAAEQVTAAATSMVTLAHAVDTTTV